MNNIRTKLDNTTKRNLITKYDSISIKDDIIYIKLKIISEQDDLKIKDFNTNEEFNYINDDNIILKYEYFIPFIDYKYGNILNLSNDEKIDLLTNYLLSKLIIIKPSYLYDDNDYPVLRSGIIINIISKLYIDDIEYFSIPILSDFEQINKFLNYESFQMSNIELDSIIKPNYLFINNTIYKVTLKVIDNNIICINRNELQLDNDKLLLNNDLIINDNNFVFINKESILTSKIKESNLTILNDIKPLSSNNILKELNKFYEYIKSKNLYYSLVDIYNFYACISTLQLTILAGLNGIGKTKLPLEFANYFNMNQESSTMLFIPISPSYTEPSDILGYFNPVNNNFTSSDTKLVEFLLHAQNNPDKMHMVIFDEMNLSQIEHWFSPFISLLENDENNRVLNLYSKNVLCNNKDIYPPSIKISKNILFVGTINLDDTTKMLSQRLIDRTFIINLNKQTFVNLKKDNLSKKDIQNKYNLDFIQMMPSVLDEKYDYIKKLTNRQMEFFDNVDKLLNISDSNRCVSFRSVKSISLYLNYKPISLDENKAFDMAFKQTILKGINGPYEFLHEVLGTLDKDGNLDGQLNNLLDNYKDLSDFKETKEELKKKVIELDKYGFTR